MDEQQKEEERQKQINEKKATINLNISTNKIQINNLESTKKRYQVLENKVRSLQEILNSARKEMLNVTNRLNTAYSSQEVNNKKSSLLAKAQQISKMSSELTNTVLPAIKKKIYKIEEEISKIQSLISKLQNEYDSLR